jgi:hypothetical protein
MNFLNFYRAFANVPEQKLCAVQQLKEQQINQAE